MRDRRTLTQERLYPDQLRHRQGRQRRVDRRCRGTASCALVQRQRCACTGGGLAPGLSADADHAESVSFLRCHSVACSYAYASLSTVDSANGAPTICRPIGSPDLEKPHGTLIAGSPVTSNGQQLRVRSGSRAALSAMGSISDGGPDTV